MEPVKIKISQSRYTRLEIAGMPNLDKYFEVDPTKKNDDFYDTNVKTPWDGEVIK